MIRVEHVKPDAWVDTSEQGKIQPSHVAGLEHRIVIDDPEDMRGPAGQKGDKGDRGEVGPAGPAGPAGQQGDIYPGDVGAFSMLLAPDNVEVGQSVYTTGDNLGASGYCPASEIQHYLPAGQSWRYLGLVQLPMYQQGLFVRVM